MATEYSIFLKMGVKGIEELKKGFNIAIQETKKFTNITDTVKNTGAKIKELTKNSLIQAVSIGATTATIVKAIKTGIEFENTFLRATTKISDGITKDSLKFKELNKLVLNLGSNTEFSTSEVAQGLEFWAMAGKSANEIMILLPQSVNFATASQLNLARASDILSDSLGIFNLNTKDTNELMKNNSRLMDVIVKTANMTNVSIEDLFETTKYAGVVFTGAGQSLETFHSSLAVLADNSIKGSMAGTALRTIMSNLASPTNQALAVLNALNISVVDNQGSMKNFADIIEDFKLKTEQFTNQQKLAIYETIAGKEAMTAFNSLVNAGGKKINEYNKMLNTASGETNKLAEIMRTTTEADVKNFTSALEGLAIQFFMFLQPAISVILKSITGLIGLFNEITGDSKILKGVFIGLGLMMLASFAPLTAIILGITIGIGALVRMFQYLYKECSLFKIIIDTIVNILQYLFHDVINIIKNCINEITNVFKSFSDGFGVGMYNVLNLIAKSIFTYLITPIKWVLMAISKIPGEIGKMGSSALESIKKFEDETFQYKFNVDSEMKEIPVSTKVSEYIFKNMYENKNNSNNSNNKFDVNLSITPIEGFKIGGYSSMPQQNSQMTLNINGGQ